ncbi:hypothetical protein LUZ61_015605 [Rhynchospora tenuis]|uniref:Hyaluronan/mRNA-binding protein domain-containing protein n=1 Tax=Rhynchospora tenuis TaxID=198213 RepID=A0AAD5Z3Z3_9POAL|nr:hypothetical protein LUZ61_015605 [Rhynchospora tenuis]
MEVQRSNPFDLLKDVDHEDPSQLIAAAKQPQKIPPVKGSQTKLPSKPLPPHQAAKEARNNERQIAQTRQSKFQHHGAYGSNREYKGNGHAQMEGARDGKASRSSSRYTNGDAKDGQRRMYDRYSNANSRPDTRGHESGVHSISEKRSKEDNGVNLEKKENRPVYESKVDKEGPQRGQEEKEPEDKEMTLEEYEKIKEGKRKALISTKTEGRKVEIDEDFKSMKQLSIKKENNEVFIQLSSNKEAVKKKEMERQEKTRKSVNINEFLRPVEGQYRSRRHGIAHGN